MLRGLSPIRARTHQACAPLAEHPAIVLRIRIEPHRRRDALGANGAGR
jgi:hypothetical protein